MIIGIDQIEKIEKYKKLKTILITTNSTYNSKGITSFKIIKDIFKDNLKEIWSLQHGFFVDKQDNMIFSDSLYWEDFDVYIRSFYKKDLKNGFEMDKDFELIIIDVFDVGTRVYTFLNHIVLILKQLSNSNVKILVLDRPNILGKNIIEGNVIEEEYFSIVGILPIPMRHSLTSAEFINFGVNYYNLDFELEIIKLKNINKSPNRETLFSNPSPNMTSFSTALVYPGAVMLEGTNISEGRGTTMPFEFLGAPFINNFSLVEKLNDLKLENVIFLPVYFKPEFSKFKDIVCKGIMVKPIDINKFGSFEVYYEIIRILYHEYEKFSWASPPYEFEYERLPIDMITGGKFIRESIESNKSFKEIEDTINNQICKFNDIVKNFVLY